MYKLYTDGGCRGNNSSKTNTEDRICGGGAVVYDKNGLEIFSKAERYLDLTTNNESEWKALVMGLQLCVDKNVPPSEVHVFCDSNLVVQQYLGTWRVKEKRLAIFREKALSFGEICSIGHVPRAQNKRADELSNIGMSMK